MQTASSTIFGLSCPPRQIKESVKTVCNVYITNGRSCFELGCWGGLAACQGVEFSLGDAPHIDFDAWLMEEASLVGSTPGRAAAEVAREHGSSKLLRLVFSWAGRVVGGGSRKLFVRPVTSDK